MKSKQRQEVMSLNYHSNGSEYRATPVDKDGIPMKWWRRPKKKRVVEIDRVTEITAGGNHVWCVLENGDRIRKKICNVPRELMFQYIGGLIGSVGDLED